MKKILVLIMLIFVVFAANSEEKLALKSARQTSSYYAFAVGIANAIMKGAPDVNITVESSAGSVENVKVSRVRKNYLFTAPPLLVKSALAGTSNSQKADTVKYAPYGRFRDLLCIGW